MASTFSGFFGAQRRLRQTRAGSMLFGFFMFYGVYSVLKWVGLDLISEASATSLALLSLCSSLWAGFVVRDFFECVKYFDESKAEEIAELDNPVPYGLLRPLAHGAASFMWFFCCRALVETMSSDPVGLFSGFNGATLLNICSMPSILMAPYLTASFMYAARSAAVEKAVKRGLLPPEAETDESGMGRVEKLAYRFYLRALRPAYEKMNSLAKRNRLCCGFIVFFFCMAVFGVSGLFELLSVGAYDFRLLAAGSLLFSIWCATAGYDMWRAYDQQPAERIEKGFPYGVVRPFVYGLASSLLFYVWLHLDKEERMSESLSWASEHLTDAYDAHVAKIAAIYKFGIEEFIMLLVVGAATTVGMLYARRRAQKKASGVKTAERG
ncbi:MAG: hypothetical protein OXT69_14530 [Candidatus Poribacteria bacterium]|nr:hypothetical protein [Candidatus Poribacteria bacterium]